MFIVSSRMSSNMRLWVSFHSRSVFCVILVVLCTAVPILGKGHTVGDSSGWAIGMDYSTWTSRKTFSVGETLGGMKLAVTVAAAGSSTKPSSSETPSSGGTTTSPASGTTTTSPAGGTTTVYKPSSNSTPDSSSGINISPFVAIAGACVALSVMVQFNLFAFLHLSHLNADGNSIINVLFFGPNSTRSIFTPPLYNTPTTILKATLTPSSLLFFSP
uniref:Phytocyanin domain-containing protein n=1 Tax=Salix viminalis TaxID=40686 RepID=A0A6N2MGZ0_SALVM